MRQMAGVVPLHMRESAQSAAGAEGYIPRYRVLDGVYRSVEVNMTQTGGDTIMKDRQQAQCMFDRFGAEIYEGEEYFAGNEGNVFVCDSENFDPGNHVICDLVETMGTRWILEQLGYQKKTFCPG